MMDFGGKHIAYQHQPSDLEAYNSTQITLRNSSAEEQWAKLFGANEGKSKDNQSFSFKTDGYPQAMLFNPLNQLLYVVNQLAATLQVFEQNGKLVKRIVLDESSILTASPLAIELNPINGEVYILGSLSDQLYVVDSKLDLIQTIALSIRPYAVKFNPINQKLYVQHLVGSSISVLDTTSDFSKEEIETNAIQNSIATNPNDGSWAVSNGTGTIKIYDTANQLIQTFELEDQTVEQLVYSKDGRELLLLDKEQQKVIVLQSADGAISQSISLGGTPAKVIRANESGYYIASTTPNSIVRLNEEFAVTTFFESSLAPYVWTVNQSEEVFFVGDPIRSKITVVDPSGEQNAVSYNEGYDEVVSDFQYRPVLVKHLRVSYSDWNKLPFIRIGRKSSAGKKESHLVSLHKYHSPQHFSPIYEVSAVKHEIIDGRTFWEVLIPPEQSVSLLIYHK